jgi:hypothetical protein
MVTRIELEKLPYGDFKEKYEELGISESFVKGAKKVILIDTALEILATKESLEVSTSAAAVIIDEQKIVENNLQEEEVATEFENEVNKVVENKDHWSEETMQKRIDVHNNIFLQHRGSVKGSESQAKKAVLEEAFKRIYKS